jgi:predicted nucleic acid-binding protein
MFPRRVEGRRRRLPRDCDELVRPLCRGLCMPKISGPRSCRGKKAEWNTYYLAEGRLRWAADSRRAACDADTYAWTATLHLCDRFRLTPYDAAYLELAQRRMLPLATLDRDLRAAVQALGTETLGGP